MPPKRVKKPASATVATEDDEFGPLGTVPEAHRTCVTLDHKLPDDHYYKEFTGFSFQRYYHIATISQDARSKNMEVSEDFETTEKTAGYHYVSVLASNVLMENNFGGLGSRSAGSASSRHLDIGDMYLQLLRGGSEAVALLFTSQASFLTPLWKELQAIRDEFVASHPLWLAAAWKGEAEELLKSYEKKKTTTYGAEASQLWWLLFNVTRIASGQIPMVFIEDEQVAAFWRRVRENSEPRANSKAQVQSQLAAATEAFATLVAKWNSSSKQERIAVLEKRHAVAGKLRAWVRKARQQALAATFPHVQAYFAPELTEWTQPMHPRLLGAYNRALVELSKRGILNPIISFVSLVGSRVYTADPNTKEYNQALDDVVVFYTPRDPILGACIQWPDQRHAERCGADGHPYWLNSDDENIWDPHKGLTIFDLRYAICHCTITSSNPVNEAILNALFSPIRSETWPIAHLVKVLMEGNMIYYERLGQQLNNRTKYAPISPATVRHALKLKHLATPPVLKGDRFVLEWPEDLLSKLKSVDHAEHSQLLKLLEEAQVTFPPEQNPSIRRTAEDTKVCCWAAAFFKGVLGLDEAEVANIFLFPASYRTIDPLEDFKLSPGDDDDGDEDGVANTAAKKRKELGKPKANAKRTKK